MRPFNVLLERDLSALARAGRPGIETVRRPELGRDVFWNDRMKSRKSKWSEEELKQLAEIVAAGGTPLRAAAKLKRNMTSCRIQARAIGLPFSPLRVRQKNLRQKCAAAERQLAR